jgi:hypothetical protein
VDELAVVGEAGMVEQEDDVVEVSWAAAFAHGS